MTEETTTGRDDAEDATNVIVNEQTGEARVVAPPQTDREEEENAPAGIPVFADPFATHRETMLDAPAGKGIGMLALESFFVMFWDQEYRHEFMERNGFDMRDGADRLMQSWARVNKEPPLHPDSEALPLPENAGGSSMDAVFNEVDAMYKAARTRPNPLNGEFSGAATVPAVPADTPASDTSLDPNRPGPF